MQKNKSGPLQKLAQNGLNLNLSLETIKFLEGNIDGKLLDFGGCNFLDLTPKQR